MTKIEKTIAAVFENRFLAQAVERISRKGYKIVSLPKRFNIDEADKLKGVGFIPATRPEDTLYLFFSGDRPESKKVLHLSVMDAVSDMVFTVHVDSTDEMNRDMIDEVLSWFE